MSTQVVKRAERYFLSHSGDDKWVALLVARIMHRHGIPFWLDVLHCQEPNNVAILRAVEKCECIVVISSRSYNTSKWCQKELQHAREHCKKIECLRLERNSSGKLYYNELPGTDLPRQEPVNLQEAIDGFFSKFVKSDLTPSETRQLNTWIDSFQEQQKHREPWAVSQVLDAIGLDSVPPDPFCPPGSVAATVAVDVEADEAHANATAMDNRHTKTRKMIAICLGCLTCLIVAILGPLLALGIIEGSSPGSEFSSTTPSLAETPIPSLSPSIQNILYESKLYIWLDGNDVLLLLWTNSTVSEVVKSEEFTEGSLTSFFYQIRSVAENVALIYFTYYSSDGDCRWTFNDTAIQIDTGLSDRLIGDVCRVGIFGLRRMDIQLSIASQ